MWPIGKGKGGEDEPLEGFREERSAIKCNSSGNPKTFLCYRISGLTAVLVAVFTASSHRQLHKHPQMLIPHHYSAADWGRGRSDWHPRSEPAQTFTLNLPSPRSDTAVPAAAWRSLS